MGRARLLKRVQLSISGCFGPCDVPNVVTISNEASTLWLGQISEFQQYQALVDWASRCKDAGELVPLPKEFQRHTLHPFRNPDSNSMAEPGYTDGEKRMENLTLIPFSIRSTPDKPNQLAEVVRKSPASSRRFPNG
ncbi:MAG TPA: hypothetical protein VMP68_28385 [Candidatus Eisenbacteria bacterium]|nr:hypothetical protein [Candidatus Eisenbacteria bacterium]